MILIGLGANLPHREWGEPRATLSAALAALAAEGVRVVRRSGWYTSPAWPPSDQPDYVNAVAVVATRLSPESLLEALLRVEARFGRRRSVPNAARPIDLDILAYDALVLDTPALVVPHPRLRERAFVLLPLAEVAPGWRHPASGETVASLVAALPAGHGTKAEIG